MYEIKLISRMNSFMIGLFLLAMFAMVVGCSTGKPGAQTTATSPGRETPNAAATATVPTTKSQAAIVQGTPVSDIISTPTSNDGKTVTVSGQTYLAGSSPKVLLDGTSGVNIIGNTASLQKGFYSLTGLYDAKTNTLSVTNSQKEVVTYQAIETAKSLGINLMPISVQGLIATPPKEVANQLSAYLNIPHLSKDIPIYPYVVYTQNGFYLALSDSNILLPAKFTFLSSGKDYSFTFCAGEVKGTLVKTPIGKISFGDKWQPDEFNGVIIADSLAALVPPVQATVKDINANPTNYAFKRVMIDGSYAVTAARVDYSDIQAPMGIGLLADTFGNFFNEDTKLRLETIDPNNNTWQLRKAKITGTVIYPTAQMLKYLDYSKPLTKAQVMEKLKPALIVDTITSDVVTVANISDLNPLTGKPSNYWGKVVEFEGYAIGTQIHLKDVASAIAGTEIPIDVTFYAVGVADKLSVGSQLAIIGLSNDVNKGTITGRFKFTVAVTQVPAGLVTGVPFSNAAFFLLNKQELPMTVPPTLPVTPTPTPPPPTPTPTPPPTVTYTITASAGANGSITPSGAVVVNSGASQIFAIAPNPGYRIANVLVDGTSVGAGASYHFINVSANHTILASFAALLPTPPPT